LQYKVLTEGPRDYLGKKTEYNAVEKEMVNAARERGLFNFSEFQEVSAVTQSRASKEYDRVVDFNRTLPERSTRPFVFFTAVDMLKKAGYEGKQLYDAAYNITQSAMVDYHMSERPMMYQKAGVVGRLAGGLQSYKHAMLNQYARQYAEAKRGNWKPLAYTMVAATTLAGVSGLPFYQEVDQLVQMITEDFFGGRKTIKELALSNAPEFIKIGAPSAGTGLNVQSRMSAADILPNSPLEAISPYAKVAGGIVESGYELATKRDPLSAKNFAVSMSPSGPIKGLVRDALFTDANGTSYDKYGEIIDKGESVGGLRTEFDRKAAKFGAGQTVAEAQRSENNYVNKLREVANQKAQGEITAKLKRKYVQGILTEEDMAEASKKYVARKGDPQQLVNSLIQYAQTTPLTRKQRAEGVPGKTLSSIYRYQNYQQTQ
jgi:hypothetical protein